MKERNYDITETVSFELRVNEVSLAGVGVNTLQLCASKEN